MIVMRKQILRGFREQFEPVFVKFSDGIRVVFTNIDGNVMFDGTHWLFDQCVALGYFQVRR